MKKITTNFTARSIVRDYILFSLNYFNPLTSEKEAQFIKKLKEVIEHYYRDSTVSNHILNHPDLKKRLPILRKLCLSYEKKLEKQYGSQYIHGDMTNLKEYLQEYEPFIKREGTMARITEDSKVVILGSGYLPGTAILLNKIFKVQCHCIDNDINAVKTSRKLIRKMGLENEIFIKFGYATTYPLDDYNAIFVTGSSFPKKDIFAHIHNKKTNNTKIIYRRPLGLYKMWYTPSSLGDINKFEIIKSVQHSKNYPFDSVLLIKRHNKP